MLVTSEQSEQFVQRAKTSLLRFRIPEAEQSLRRLALRPDGAAAAHHLLATSAFLVGLVSDSDADFEKFAAHADTLDRLLRDVGSSCWSDYMRAETALQRGVVLVKQERYLPAAWYGRSAYKHYERAVEQHPDFAELKKGIGLMHLGIGSLPGTWRRFLRILGYKGTVSQGIAELEVAASRAPMGRDAAELSLGLALVMLGLDPDEGTSRLNAVHRRHPESPFFGYLYAFVLLDKRDAATAQGILERYAAQGGDGVHHYINFVDYFLARAYFVQDRFPEAERHYKLYLARHKGRSLKAAARLALGHSVEMQGRRDEALRHYRGVEVARAYDTDEASKREAQIRLRTPLEGAQRQLLLAANAYDSGHNDRAETLLTSVLASPSTSSEEKVEAAYRLGRVSHAQGDEDEAMRRYHYAIEHARDPQAKWAPWAQFYIGEIHADRGQRALARDAYAKALGYRGPYDYHQTLEQSARAALERLRHEG